MYWISKIKAGLYLNHVCAVLDGGQAHGLIVVKLGPQSTKVPLAIKMKNL